MSLVFVFIQPVQVFWLEHLTHLCLRLLSICMYINALEKEMATHSSVLAWRIPGMGEPGGLPSMGLHRVRHNWSDLAAVAAAPSAACLIEVSETHQGKLKKGPIPQNKRSEVTKALPHEHSSLSAQRKLTLSLQMCYGLLWFFMMNMI